MWKLIERIVQITLGLFVLSIVLFFAWRKAYSKKYTEDFSPDGNYKITVFQYPPIGFGFPGQSGSGGNSGYLVLRDVNTNEKIDSEETYMLDAVFPIIWTPEEVTAGRFILIKLPETYHNAQKNRQYFLQKRLIQAAKNGDISLVIKLLKEGAVLDEKDFYLDNPLYIAASENHFEVVSFLLKQGDYLQRLNKVKNGILNGRFIQQNPKMIAFLIRNGLNLNQVNRYGSSPLLSSIRFETFETFKILVENDATIDLEDPNVQEDFQRASPEFQKKVLELLKERKEDE